MSHATITISYMCETVPIEGPLGNLHRRDTEKCTSIKSVTMIMSMQKWHINIEDFSTILDDVVHTRP